MTHRLDAYPTADLVDAFPNKVRLVQATWQDFGGVHRFAGRARTALVVEDTKLLSEQLYAAPGNGAVAVVDGGGSMNTALLGDVNAEKLRRNGWAGIVIFGAVRDVAASSQVSIGIKALGRSPLRSGKLGSGWLNVPLAFGSALIAPGDCIYCDEDGVLVSSHPLNPAA